MVNIIILAAGESKRLGTPKQLVRFKGKSLIRHSIDVALNSNSDHVFVVLGAYGSLIKNDLKDLPYTPITNDNWMSGMGSSIKKGISECITRFPATEAIILMTCDQPYINPQILDELIQFYNEGETVVSCRYSETIGIPALFGRNHFEELLAIKNAEGAKKILQRHPLALVEFENGKYDIDTPDDLNSIS